MSKTNQAEREAGRRAAQSIGGGDTTIEDFLGLTPRQMWLIDLKIDLGQAIKERRIARGWTQSKLAQVLEISQPRVANIEAGGPSVTVDFQLMALQVLGVSRDYWRQMFEEQFEDKSDETNRPERELVTA